MPKRKFTRTRRNKVKVGEECPKCGDHLSIVGADKNSLTLFYRCANSNCEYSKRDYWIQLMGGAAIALWTY